MRFLARSMVAVVMLAVTLALLGLAGATIRTSLEDRAARKTAPPTARERVFAANVVTIEAGTIIPEMEAFGEVRARRTLDLRAPRGGRVVWLAEGFEDGGAVTAGQLLVQLDPSDATAARDLALSDRARAEAEVRDASRALTLAEDEVAAAQAQAALRAQALERQRSLRERGVGSDAALEAAELAASQADQAVLSRRQALAQAQTRVDQASVAFDRLAITLAEAERALAETRITAGFDGRLAAVAVVEGGIVGQNERLAQIIDPDALEVMARLSTAQYGRLVGPDGALRNIAGVAVLDVMGVELSAPAVLARSGAVVGEGQSGRVIYATLGAAPGFRPGDFVTLRLPEPAIDGAVLLSSAAVGADGAVLALGEGDRLEAIPVTVLRRQGDKVIVEAGPIAGRELVAERNALLGAGIRVRPVRPEGAAAPEPELIELTPERRAALIAMVEGNSRMPQEAKARILAQLGQDKVPAQVISRLESRMGG